MFSPAIRSPLWLDDYTQAAMVEGTFPVHRGPTGLYDFVGDDDRQALLDRGVLPWWTNPTLKVRFFRPLSSALLYAEHRVFSHAPLPMHLSSFAWWIAAVLAARSLFRRVGLGRAATIATVVFALSPCHALPLAWVANREVLMSLTFGALALGALVRTRAGPSVGAYLAATFFFALAAASGEYGMCFGGYVIAFELTREGGFSKKLAGLATFGVPAAAYMSVRAALHFGTAGSGFYHDPLRVPGVFLAAAPRRFITLLADGWLTGDVDAWGADAPAWVMLLALATSLYVFWGPLRRSARASGAAAHRELSWLTWGSLLALLPVLAAAPSARLLAVAVLGLSPRVAVLIDHAWFSRTQAALKDGRLRVAAVAMAFLHFVHGPAVSWLTSRALRRTSVESDESAAWLRARIPDVPSANVIVTRAAWQSVGPFALDFRAAPASWRVLVIAKHALVLRTDDRTIDVVIPKGQGFYPAGSDDIFRSDDDPIRSGDEVVVPGMRVTVIDSGEDGPARMRFAFDRDLDDPSLTWVTQTASTFKDSPAPKTGFGTPLDP